MEARLAGLMQGVQQGERAATPALVREAGPWLNGYFRRRLSTDTCEDLVQETLAALFARQMAWQPDRPFIPWLAGIARFRWLEHLRRAYARHDHARADLDEAALAHPAGIDLEEAILARPSLEQLFARIPDSQVLAIRLVKLKGYSVSEASRMSGQSESLVKVNVHRGIRRMAALVAQAT